MYLEFIVKSFRHPRLGYEVDWLGVDAHGHLGLFSTGGQGPIPEDVVRHLADVEAAVQRLLTLPVVGECAESPTGGGDYDSWIEPARRGIFGFDWGPIEAPPYVRLTVPSNPVSLDDVADSAIRRAASLAQVPLDFQTTSRIGADDLGIPLFGERPA
jgi:hypothetical protein